MVVRPFHNTMLYASLLADDISFSSITDTSSDGNNNKFAFQFGGSRLFFLNESPLLVSAEYVRVTPFTYSHRQISNSWTHLGAPLGYNIQPNSDRLALQAKYWLTPRTYLKIDADYTRWGENILDSNSVILTKTVDLGNGNIMRLPIGNVGGDMLRGDGDFLPYPYNVGNSFLRGNVSHTRRIQAWLSSQIFQNIFADARLQYLSRTGGNYPINQLWFSLEIRIGY